MSRPLGTEVPLLCATCAYNYVVIRRIDEARVDGDTGFVHFVDVKHSVVMLCTRRGLGICLAVYEASIVISFTCAKFDRCGVFASMQRMPGCSGCSCTCTLLLTTALRHGSALCGTKTTRDASRIRCKLRPRRRAATRDRCGQHARDRFVSSQARAPTKEIDDAVDARPLSQLSAIASGWLARGRWRVVHAPHIKNIPDGYSAPVLTWSTTSGWTATAVPWNRT